MFRFGKSLCHGDALCPTMAIVSTFRILMEPEKSNAKAVNVVTLNTDYTISDNTKLELQSCKANERPGY